MERSKQRWIRLAKVGGAMAAGMVTIWVVLFEPVDRRPFQEMDYYTAMQQTMDSIGLHMPLPDTAAFLAGWATVNITPLSPTPLAGYGSRDLPAYESVRDSSFASAVVLKSGASRVAVISADLLIIHPELAHALDNQLPEGWIPAQIFYTATHTHSGQGGWAPGIAGKLFAGSYDSAQVSRLSRLLRQVLLEADTHTDTASLVFAELAQDDLVKNRLVKDAATDPWMKLLSIRKAELTADMIFFSAHATCLSAANSRLSGDFPAAVRRLVTSAGADFCSYHAGAVGSMSVAAEAAEDESKLTSVAHSIATQVELYHHLGGGDLLPRALRAFRIPLAMPSPALKISENWALRSYWFRRWVGEYEHYLSVVQIGDVLMVGMPADFSGELAVPLYEYAHSKGLNLIISSFNGDYMGYIIADEHYDLSKYEARTMSWYGPHAGAYLTEIIKRTIDLTAK